jgi:hypothetical protein
MMLIQAIAAPIHFRSLCMKNAMHSPALAVETETPIPTPAPRRNVDAIIAGGSMRSDRPDRVRRKDIHDKWPKISDVEANGLRDKPELAALLQARYGLSAEQARIDIDAWAKHRVF